MRRLAAVVSLLALVAVPAALASATPGAEKERLNARDTKLAQATALTKADLGRRWSVRKLPKVPAPACKSFAPDLSKFTVTGKAHTLFVDTRGASVQSTVEVFADAKQAAADFEATAKPNQARCLREGLAHAQKTAGRGVTLGFESAKMLDAPKVGKRAARYRLVGTLGSRGVSFPLYMDLVVVQRGRTLVTLFFTGLEAPVADQVKVARKVAARMR